jgi:hypothetical protein
MGWKSEVILSIAGLFLILLGFSLFKLARMDDYRIMEALEEKMRTPEDSIAHGGTDRQKPGPPASCKL